ncbi:hypothetical protein D3C81_1249470 [compost metagenome]
MIGLGSNRIYFPVHFLNEKIQFPSNRLAGMKQLSALLKMTTQTSQLFIYIGPICKNRHFHAKSLFIHGSVKKFGEPLPQPVTIISYHRWRKLSKLSMELLQLSQTLL